MGVLSVNVSTESMNTRLLLPTWTDFLHQALLLVLFSMSPVLAQTSTVRYVRVGAVGSGSSWADASGDLQSQINLTGTQQVWVAQGIYKPGPAGTTDRGLSFSMKNGVSILGGFPASGTPALGQRNPASFTTVLSGDISTVGDLGDNSYHVINNLYIDNTAVLDGFIIRDGNANGVSVQSFGGGIHNSYSSSPTLINCSFQGNSAIYGAGMYNNYSNPTLINCSFQSNSAQFGGGIWNDASSPSLTNCSFQGNSGAQQGGVMYNRDSSPSITNCVMFGNGGANTFVNAYSNTTSNITIRYSLLEAGVTDYTDGGNNLITSTTPFVSGTDARLNNCAPAINAGDNNAYTSASGPTTDLGGNARIFPTGGRIDMGAYEFQATPGVIVTNPSVSTATTGTPFSQSFTAAAGTSPYSFSLVSGSLPPGLSLATTGTLSGTPTQAGSFTLSVKVADAIGCSGISALYTLTVREPAPTLPDLSPILYARPTLVYGQSPFTVVVDVLELNSVASSGSFKVWLTRDQQFSLSFDASLSSLNGRSVQNSVWSFSDADPNYYVLTTSQPIAPGDKLSFGLSGSLRPGASSGMLTLSSTVVAGTVVESRGSNNIDADKVEYFQQ